MRYTASCTFAVAFHCAIQGGSAQEQSRVFVAAQGLDSDPCNFASPCRTFQHAHDVVAANGEIDELGPAGYGPLSIQGHDFSGMTVPSGGENVTLVAFDVASFSRGATCRQLDKSSDRRLAVTGVSLMYTFFIYLAPVH